jgi:hypothetical protein
MMTDFLTYELLEHGAAIRCRLCGRTSHNPKDVEHLYCGACHRYHVDVELAACSILLGVQALAPRLDPREQVRIVALALAAIAQAG